MKKEYVYRKHIRLLQKLALPISILLGMVMLVLAGVMFFIESEPVSWILFLVLSIIMFVEGFVIDLFYKRFTKVKVLLYENGIRYINYKGEIKIPYDDIIKLEFPQIKFLGGWIKIISKEETIRLTVVVEDIQRLLHKLKTELDKRDMQQVYHEPKFLSFFQTATFADASWMRLYRIAWPSLLILLFVSVITVLITLIFSVSEVSIILIMIGLVIWLMCYLVAEFQFVIKIREEINRYPFTLIYNDVAYENKWYKILTFIGLVVYGIVAAVMMVVTG